MKISIGRKIMWHSGHRLVNHEGACKAHHGHEYVAWIECRAERLDPLGRVIDFEAVKRIVGSWVGEKWDHTYLLNAEDDDAGSLSIRDTNRSSGRPCYLFDGNPTCENIALELFNVSCMLLCPYFVEVKKVILYETENAYAVIKAADEAGYKPVLMGYTDES